MTQMNGYIAIVMINPIVGKKGALQTKLVDETSSSDPSSRDNIGSSSNKTGDWFRKNLDRIESSAAFFRDSIPVRLSAFHLMNVELKNDSSDMNNNNAPHDDGSSCNENRKCQPTRTTTTTAINQRGPHGRVLDPHGSTERARRNAAKLTRRPFSAWPRGAACSRAPFRTSR